MIIACQFCGTDCERQNVVKATCPECRAKKVVEARIARIKRGYALNKSQPYSKEDMLDWFKGTPIGKTVHANKDV